MITLRTFAMLSLSLLLSSSVFAQCRHARRVVYYQPTCQTAPAVQTVNYHQPVQVQRVQSRPVTQTFTSSSGFSSASNVDPVFQANNPNSTYSVDHSSWNQFLSRNLASDGQGVNRVHYGRVSGQDRQLLGGYLQQLQGTDIRALNRNEQFAYWVNLYNARTVALVLDNYPVQSIQQINNGKAFDQPGVVTVLGKSLSLNDIESKIVRPVYNNDPRIHYALNCAAYGCPNLAPTAYTSQNLNGRLDQAARQFINTDRAVQRTANGVQVSKIYQWYQEDFGGSPQGVIAHLRQYANPTTLAKLNGVNQIEGYYYDWSLNDSSGYSQGYSSGQPVYSSPQPVY